MKPVIGGLGVILILLNLQANAQDTTQVKKPVAIVFMALGAGASTEGLAGKFGVTYFSRNRNWGLGFSARGISHRAAALPADYHPGTGFSSSSGSTPKDEVVIVSLGYLLRFPGKAGRAYFYTDAGLSMVRNTYYTFEPYSPGWGVITSSKNYRDIEHVETHAGIYASPRVNYSFNNWLGLQASVLALYSKPKSVAGVELALLIGNLK
ncbi:MAG: hypothetical protein K0Q66_273 [Chitinophagaceae bacterium]|jgi:hypothetical protein|nr:hypothetical protein [Chitinophagaceae bacterium]